MNVEDVKAALVGLEGKLADAKAQRDRILIDVRKASAAVDTGDQRARFAQGALNKEDAAAGRLILSLEAQVAEARKRLAMAETQAAIVEAKRASADAWAAHDRLFEVTTHDGRVVRHRHESAGALQKVLTPGYRVVAEVFGAGIDDKGGMIEPIGQSTMKTLLAAHGDELVAFLAERGIKAAKGAMTLEFHKVLPNDPPIVMYAKIAVNQGRSPGMEKHDFYDAIMKRAEALRADGESPQQAFSKVITEDETGRLLYKAMQIAPGSEVKPASQPAPPKSGSVGEAPRACACAASFASR